MSEQKAPKGYILDSTPKNIVVCPGAVNSLIFDDQPETILIIQKFIKGTESEPLSGVAFKVTDGDGAAVGPDDGVYYTDKKERFMNYSWPGNIRDPILCRKKKFMQNISPPLLRRPKNLYLEVPLFPTSVNSETVPIEKRC